MLKQRQPKQPVASSTDEHPAVQGFRHMLANLDATAGAALEKLNRDLEHCLHEIAGAKAKR